MLERLFVRPGVIARMRQGPLGPYVDQLETSLDGAGYAPSSLRCFLGAAEKFAQWLHGQGYTVCDMDEELLSQYLTTLSRYRRGNLPKAAQGLHSLVSFLHHHGVTRPRHAERPLPPIEQWLHAYDAHLEHVAGIALRTRQGYGYFVRRFLTACFGSETPHWPSLTASMITAFIRQEVTTRQQSGRKRPAVAIRSFLRFLVFQGDIRPGLEAAALAPVQWKYAALPARLLPEEVERVLAVYHDGTAIGLRNRAMLFCLARLGLRAQDVLSLSLDDIDWADGRLTLRPGKSRQTRSLPLPDDVGHAVVAYLQGGRPQSNCRQVFVRSRPPFRALTRNALWAVVRHAFTHAGIDVPSGVASHIFRHTLASEMVNHGASFKAVADVLGHQSLHTTGIYAKLDLEALAAVALPWAGETL